MDQMMYLFIPALFLLCCAVFLFVRHSEHSREIDYLKKKVASLEDESHKNWLDIRKVSDAAGLKWIPREEGKWVKE